MSCSALGRANAIVAGRLGTPRRGSDGRGQGARLIAQTCASVSCLLVASWTSRFARSSCLDIKLGLPTRTTPRQYTSARSRSGNPHAHRCASQIVGIILAIASGLLIGSSFVFKKKGLLRAQAGGVAGEGVGYLKSPLWWLGMSSAYPIPPFSASADRVCLQ